MAASSIIVGEKGNRIKPQVNRYAGVLDYGIDNAYPQRFINVVAGSGTALSCLNTYAKFLKGKGFEDEPLNKVVVNGKGQTLEDILSLVSTDYAYFNKAYVHVSYNGLLKINQLQFVPYEFVRFINESRLPEIPLMYAVYDDWTYEKRQNLKKDLVQKINFYDSREFILMKQIELDGGIEKFKGQLFCFTDGDLRSYTTATGDAVMMDIESDQQCSVFTWRMLKTGFIQQTFFFHKGRFSSDTERDEFRENLNSTQGADNSNQIILVEMDDESQKPEITSIPVVLNDKLFDSTQTKTKQNIIKNYYIPLALMSEQIPGSLGLSREFEDAQKTYSMLTEGDRTIISNCFKKLMENWHDILNPTTWNIIPLTGLASNNEVSIMAEKLGVGALTGMVSILQDTVLTPSQKINTLIIVYGLSYDNANSMVTGAPIINES